MNEATIVLEGMVLRDENFLRSTVPFARPVFIGPTKAERKIG